jgi:hypothetical protein
MGTKFAPMMLATIITLGLSTGSLFADAPDASIFGTTSDPNALFFSLAENIGKAIMPNTLEDADVMDFCGLGCGYEISLTEAKTGLVGDTPGVNRFLRTDLHAASIGFTRLTVRKSLPFSFVFIMNAGMLAEKYPALGVGVSFNVFEGTPLTPALSIEAGYASMLDFDDISVSASQIDFVVSQRLGPFSPYAGIAKTSISSSVTSSGIASTLTGQSISMDQYKSFLGLKTQVGGFILVGEADFNYSQTYSLKIGYEF